MTWSIVARDSSGAFGVAVASKAFAVGALCPHARSGVGALSTQALVNPNYASPALDLLAEGSSPLEVIRLLVTPDEGRDHRQLHLVDRSGRTASHTGSKCVQWCGHIGGATFSVAGNMLAGERVIRDTAAAFRDSKKPFAERLIAALEAGEAAGGDKRGRQSAALLVFSNEQYPDLDLRVDDHAEPIAELVRLYDKAHERFVPYLKCSPSKARPWGITERSVIEQEIARHKKPA